MKNMSWIFGNNNRVSKNKKREQPKKDFYEKQKEESKEKNYEKEKEETKEKYYEKEKEEAEEKYYKQENIETEKNYDEKEKEEEEEKYYEKESKEEDEYNEDEKKEDKEEDDEKEENEEEEGNMKEEDSSKNENYKLLLEEVKFKQCSLLEHKDTEAINYCQECKIFMCNKCEKHHSELFKNHHQYTLDKNTTNIFTGLCKEKNHSNKLEYFCNNHNQLCCVACIAKIKGKGNGKHKDCDICFIEKIKKNKKKSLDKNLNYLGELSKTLNESINELKKIFEKIVENKEALKMEIQKIFTKIRNTFNEREDELLLEVDKKYDNLFFKEELIKTSEKLPNITTLLIKKGKKSDEQWNDKDKLNSIINDCIDIENNIKDIKEVNEKIKKCKSINIKIKFNPKEDDINRYIKNIKDFGNIYHYDENSKEEPTKEKEKNDNYYPFNHYYIQNNNYYK